MDFEELIDITNEAFFTFKHDDKRYSKGWCDAFKAVNDAILDAFEEMEDKEQEDDPVSHPAHYCDGGIETLDFIVAKKMDFFLGQVCKYITRAGKKDPAKELEDLKKAQFYLDRKIQLMEGGRDVD